MIIPVPAKWSWSIRIKLAYTEQQKTQESANRMHNSGIALASTMQKVCSQTMTRLAGMIIWVMTLIDVTSWLVPSVMPVVGSVAKSTRSNIYACKCQCCHGYIRVINAQGYALCSVLWHGTSRFYHYSSGLAHFRRTNHCQFKDIYDNA